MLRSEVKTEYKWDLSELYSNFEDWEKDLEKVKKMLSNVQKYKGHLLDSANSLYSYFKDDEEISSYLDRLHFYVYLLIDEDVTNNDVQKRLDIISDVIATYNSSISFVNPELLKGDYSLIEKFYKEEKRLKEYERVLMEIYRLKEHMLTEGEEALINEMSNISQSFQSSSQIIRNSEIDFGEITLEDREKISLSASTISKYSRSDNREIRRQVYENEGKAYERHINSLATNYIGFIKNYETEAKYRKYPSFLDQKLYNADINRSVYESIKKVVNDNVHVFQKYLQFIKDCLGVEKLEPYDVNAPLIKSSNKDYSIEEAKDIILNALSFYGQDYKEALEYAFSSRSIDFLPSENKVTGWYSAYNPYSKPKIFANYNGKIMDVSSLVHELGHFVNQYKIIENQPPQYVYQSTFCAEVASLNNEIVFSRRMMEIEDNIEIKKELLVNFIKTFASNFFGAMKQALFEEEAHNLIVSGKGATANDLCDIWRNINNHFNGDLLESKYAIGWAAIPHYYMGGGFYVFNYSTGIVAATNLAEKLLNNENGIQEKFMKYLTIGNSLPPIESLKILDIDMTTTKPYEVAIETFAKALDEFYKINEN